MIAISNSDFKELLSCLEERATTFCDGEDLRSYNRRRRRKMLLRKLKRKYEKDTITPVP